MQEQPQTARPGITDEQRRQRSESRKINTQKHFMDKVKQLCDWPEEDLQKATASIVCTLEQRLTGEEAFDFEAQLPAKLRELLVRCERHEGAPASKFGLQEFYQRIGDDIGKGPNEVVGVVRAVFLALKGQISKGEADDVASQLPLDLKEIWIYP